jgi:hypothetical protein
VPAFVFERTSDGVGIHRVDILPEDAHATRYPDHSFEAIAPRWPTWLPELAPIRPISSTRF